MSNFFYISLNDNAEALWPHQFIPQPAPEILEDIWLEPIRIMTEPAIRLRTAILLTHSIELGIPGLDNTSLVLGTAGTESVFIIEIELDPIMLGRLTSPLAIRFRNKLLRPVRIVPGELTSPEAFEVDYQAEYLDILIGDAIVSLDQDGNITINSDLGITIPRCAVGDTGLIIEAKDVVFNLKPEAPAIIVTEANILLPNNLLAPDISVTMSNSRIDSTGFTGEVSLDLNLEYDETSKLFNYQSNTPGGTLEPAQIFSLNGGLRHVGIRIEQNQLTACDISGAMVIPYFDAPVDIRVNIQPNGSFTVTLLNAEPDKPLTKDQLLELYLESLEVDTSSDQIALVVSGGLKPLLQSSDGMGWPRLDVKDLRIDSTGKISIKEAWLDLTESKPLDLYGFTLDLDRIGLGVEPNDQMWIDLSGSLRLLPQIPVGLGVEGFRLAWPMDLSDVFNAHPNDPLGLAMAISEKIEIQFKGVQLFFGVPKAVEFEGLIRFFKSASAAGFMGDVALRVPATGFSAEAGLLVGMKFTPPIYPFLYVALAVDLPAGIPLGQSGLALKGAQGMFGINVRPAKSPEQNWYYDWYKRTPVGAHPAAKWINDIDALAFGAGLTITTVDGYVKGTRGLLVLSLPGPVLMIEGRALLFNGLTPGEPPLRALAIFDGNAQTVQFNVDAQATIVEKLIEAYGGLEAFFDFNDITNWHLYLGQDAPPDRLISANVLNLFQANAYLMLDMMHSGTQRTRMGVMVGFKPPIEDVGPLHIDFDATLSGSGVVTVRPEQFSGSVGVNVNVGLSAFGFKMLLSAGGNMRAEGPKPLTVATEVYVKAELPFPLGTYDQTFQFAWQAPDIPLIESPLTEIAVNSRFAPSGGGFSPNAEEDKYKFLEIEPTPSNDWKDKAEVSPIVPADSTPILAFGQVMNSQFFAGHPSDHTFFAGSLKFTPSLTEVKLFEHKKSDDWSIGWTEVAVSGNPELPLPGVWLTESDPQSPTEPAPRRLQLWTDNPLIHTGRAPGYSDSVWTAPLGKTTSLAERILEDYPDLMQPDIPAPHWVCVKFDDAIGVTIPAGSAWEHAGLRFNVPNKQTNFSVVRETQSVPKPELTRTRIQQIVRLLGRRNILFQKSSNVTLQKLRTWAKSIKPKEQAALQKALPSLGWLWNWLFSTTITHACLVGSNQSVIDIRFPALVQEVRIRFCKSTSLPADPKDGRITTNRQPRIKEEIETVLAIAEAKHTQPDFQACSITVNHQLQQAKSDTWTLSSAEESLQGFQCLRIELKNQDLEIQEICYLTVAEAERVEHANRQVQTNINMPYPMPGNLLNPDSYYCLAVSTEVKPDLPGLGLPEEGWLEKIISDAYIAAAKLLVPNLFKQAIFFQTEGPPTNLRPYIKWTSPEHQSERVFRTNDIVVRFLRSNISAMFKDQFLIAIEVCDAQGTKVVVETINNEKAGSATRFPEEEVWETYRQTLQMLENWPDRPVPNDDYLIAKLTEKLAPKTRYTVKLLRPDLLAADPQHPERSILHTFTFTTSTYESFEDLVDHYTGKAISLDGKSGAAILAETMTNIFHRSLENSLITLERQWQKDLIDYQFETLTGGREALEASRLARRNIRATYDEIFRKNVEGLVAGLYFQPLSDQLECYLVKDPNNHQVVCVWLRSPESLDLRMSIPSSRNMQSGVTIGRTTFTVSLGASALCPIQLSNADSTQVLLVLPHGQSWAAGEYTLQFTYHQNYDDETGNSNHRYDRPVEMTNRQSGVPIKIPFTILPNE